MDYYKILNVKENASLKEIEQAYKELSCFYNPENNVSKLAYKKYREINRAYNVLKEVKQREIYNLSKVNNEVEKIKEIDGNKLDISEFNVIKKSIKDIEYYKDAIVDDVYFGYTHLTYDIPYLYYLTNSEYKIEFYDEQIISSEGICPHCLGIGKVKENEKVVCCKYCKSSGKNIKTKKKPIQLFIGVDDKVILEEYKVVVTFNFIDKDDYVVNSNEILFKKKVNENDFYNGINYHLKRDQEELNIVKNDYSQINDTYVFLDKVIHIEYILDKYKGRDLYGYIVSDSDVIYLNTRDYSYSEVANGNYNYKLELDRANIVLEDLGEKGLNDKNGDLFIEVIRIENHSDLKIFFNKKIKKVSSSLFKINGEYNNHHFKGGKNFDYDDNYLYIPSKAYKLEIKNFILFKIILSLVFIFMPFVLLLIFGFGYVFFISSFIVLALLLVGINLIMEVKI